MSPSHLLYFRKGISVSVKSADLESDANNSALLENLRDQYLILTNKLIPLAKKWIVILTKAGNEDTRELLKPAIDLKVRLEQTEVKAKALGDEVLTRREKKPASSKQVSSRKFPKRKLSSFFTTHLNILSNKSNFL